MSARAQEILAEKGAVPTVEPEAGPPLLDDVYAFLTGYVAFPSEAAAVAVTLWSAHAHLVGTFASTPRLALVSPEPSCGKTRVLELLELLCPGAELMIGPSASYLFRRADLAHATEPQPVTLLLDETDAVFTGNGGNSESAEAVRQIVNAGHRHGATVGRTDKAGDGFKVRRFRVFAPVALGHKGEHLPDTIKGRSVIVRMRRIAPDEHVHEFRERLTRPEGETLRDRLADWCATVAGQVGDPWPAMPPGVRDRATDVWEPLLMVADLAGGDWPERARAACLAFVTGARADDVSVGVRLLGDLHGVFGDEEVMATERVLTGLRRLDEAPWADWYGKPLDARNLAKLLRPYGISSTKVRIGDSSVRGYRRDDLWDAWVRYLPGRVDGTSGTSGTPLASTVPDVPDVPDTEPPTLCTVCATPLHPHLVELGETTHPNCAPGDRPPGICGICGAALDPDRPDRAVCDACRDQLARQLSSEVSA